MTYLHTQDSPAGFRAALLVALALVVAVAALGGSALGLAMTFIVAAFVAAAMAVLGRLTTEVTDRSIEATFRMGWPRKTLRWEDVATVRAVRNRWWYGWGIRWFPGGTLWNLWGLDAVEFEMVKGRKVRIGTDEPDALLAAMVGRVPVG